MEPSLAGVPDVKMTPWRSRMDSEGRGRRRVDKVRSDRSMILLKLLLFYASSSLSSSPSSRSASE